MKGMKSAEEFQQAPSPGRYWCVIATAEARFSTKGSSMLKLTPTIADPRFPQYADLSADDYIITDGGAKGGGMGKTKLRGLGVDVDSSDAELADEAICTQLQGRGVWVDFGNEQRMTRADENSPYDIPITAIDPKTGATIKIMKLNVKAYATHNVGVAQNAAPHAQPGAPTGAPQAAPYAQPQFQQAPAQPQFAQAPVPQFAQQGQPQFQQVPQQAPAQPQFQQAPQQGFAPAPGFAPPPNAGMQSAFPQGMQQAAPPWNGQPQQNGAPPSAAPKKGKKVIQDVPNDGQPQ